MDKAEDILNEDMGGERTSTLSYTSPQGQISEGLEGDVRGDGVYRYDYRYTTDTPVDLLIHKHKFIKQCFDFFLIYSLCFTESSVWNTSACLSAEW